MSNTGTDEAKLLPHEIFKSLHGIDVEVVDTAIIERIQMTDELAEAIECLNYERSRPVGDSTVKQYATDMAAGKWDEQVCNALQITQDGILIDGQHRIYAMMESDVYPTAWFYANCTTDDYAFIDRNRKRTDSDALDCEEPVLVERLGKAACCIEKSDMSLSNCFIGKMTSRSSVGSGMSLDYERENAEELLRCIGISYRISSSLNGGKKCKAPQKAVMVFVWLARWMGFAHELDVFVDYFDGTLVGKSVPRDTKEAVIRCKTGGRARMPQKDVLAVLLIGFDAFLQGDKTVKSFNKKDAHIEMWDKRIRAKRNELRRDERPALDW